MKSVLFVFALFVATSAQATTCQVVDPCKHASYGVFPVCFESIIISDEDIKITRVQSVPPRNSLPSLEYPIVNFDPEIIVAIDERNENNRVKINLNSQVLSGKFTYNFDGEKIYDIECNPL